MNTEKPVLLSVVVPVYRGAKILNDTFARLVEIEKELPAHAQLEIIAVDDGSDDDSFAVILAAQQRWHGKLRAVKLARNFGSMVAIQAGFQVVRGDCVALVPQDMQDTPPDLLLRMFSAWREGTKINIGIREGRDEPMVKRMLSAIYHFFFARLVMSDYPRGGLGGFLVDRQAVDTLLHYPEPQDVAAQFFAMGFSRRLHPFFRPSPPAGMKSGWTVAKSIKLAIDNFIAFSYLPARLMSVLGFLTAGGSFVFTGYILLGKLTGWYVIDHPPGWASMVVIITFFSGVNMIMFGVVGEYLWRTLAAARKRPLFIIDEIREPVDGEQ